MTRCTLAAMAALSLAGCAPPAEGPGNETPQGQPVAANVGSTFELRIPANESTGYHWALSAPLDSTKLADRGHRFVPSDPSGRTNGSGGMEVWRFEALDTGSTEVALHYRRGRGTPAGTRRYPIVIR